MDSLPSKPRLCRIVRGSDGYGFNLHSEKGQHGHLIRAVDPESPAETSGLRTGDRVIEVNGVNIERETHKQVVARIRAGGDQTGLLVVDKELDNYCHKNSLTIKASMIDSVELDLSPLAVNGVDHEEVDVHMNEDEVKNGEVVVARIESGEEATPESAELANERQEETEEREEATQDNMEDHGYAEIQRSDDEEMLTTEAEMGEGKATDDERPGVVEEEIIQPEQNTMEESIPAPPQDTDEESDEIAVPVQEPEPVVEAANFQSLESAPPPREPSPEPMREATPEPVREPSPEPVREPTPEPEPEPIKAPAPQPPVEAPKKESAPPPRPTEPPTDPQQRKSEMEKARILAAGRRKKKEASAKNWEAKYAAFNDL